METIRALDACTVPTSRPVKPLQEVISVFPARASQVCRIRHLVRKIARTLPFTPDQIDDICIATGEAATNAVKHGHNPLCPRVEVRVRKFRDSICVCIVDSGPGFDPDTVCASTAQDLRECGRGLLCMRTLMDEVAFHRLESGMCVEMTKRIRRG